MTKWSKELIQCTKDHFRDHHDVVLSTEDAIQSLNNVTAFFEILDRWDRDDKVKRHKGDSAKDT